MFVLRIAAACPRKPPTGTPASMLAQGLGDRMRGMMFLLRVAAAYGRVLLIDSTHPAPFEEFFAPAAINWTMMGINITGKREFHHFPAHRPDGLDVPYPHWVNGTLDVQYAGVQSIDVRCMQTAHAVLS